MNGHAVESMSSLRESGISDLKKTIQEDPALQDLDASKLTITHTTTPRPVPELNSKEVWSVKACTDHMVTVKWTDDVGWHAPEIKPYGPLTIMPTASCLHYATQCFEGMKVYRGFDGKLRLFRPDKNCARLVTSSVRVTLPPFNPVELEKLIKAFMALDGSRESPDFLMKKRIVTESHRLATKIPSRNIPLPPSSNHRKRRANRHCPAIRSLAIHHRCTLAGSLNWYSSRRSSKASRSETPCFQGRHTSLARRIRLCQSRSKLRAFFCQSYGRTKERL